MAQYGYGGLKDRVFLGFEKELETGAWKEVGTKKIEAEAKESVTALLKAPLRVTWKVRLRFGIAGVIAALGVPQITELDATWDSSQRRLFHRLGAAVDDKDSIVRAAADRLWPVLLLGTGTQQTTLDYDDEVNFGRRQVAAAGPGGPLAADAKIAKIETEIADIDKATEALAAGLGRGTGSKRRAPSQQVREAVADCAKIFNGVHDDLVWFVEHAPSGPERDHLSDLLAPLNALLDRSKPVAAPTEEAASPEEPATPAAPAEKKPA